MAEGSSAAALKEAFQMHLRARRVRSRALSRLPSCGRSNTGKKCAGMEGVIQEGAEALEEEGDETVLNLGLIGAGSRVEHYEMAGYITASSLAKRMGATEIVTLLSQSLAEEEMAERKLRNIVSGLLKGAPLEA